MDWVINVATSEFLWGIVLGLLLAVVVAAATIRLDQRRNQKMVARLCQDLIGNVCDLIQNLEDNRDKNRVIDHEYLETITAEIIVYGRTREHLVVMNDAKLRNDIRDFFVRVAALLAVIRNQLARFQEAHDKGDTERCYLFLGEAHRRCDNLRDLLNRRGDLETRLTKASRG